MKYRLFSSYALPVLLFCGAFLSCDKIDKPLKNEYGFINNPDDTGSDGVKKTVLLEEFTGVRCTNCPAAARTAKSIQENYPERVMIISIHAGFYASPDSKHPVDLRTSLGDELLDILAPGQQGFPVGMFNRHGYSEDNHLFTSYSVDWPAQITERLKDPVQADISGDLSLTGETFEVQLEVDILQDFEDANLFICAYLIEDSIIAPQTDNGVVIKDYVQNHVLRAAFNGALGTELVTGSLNSGDQFTKIFTLAKDEEWVPENCHAIAFVYDGATYEILQSCAVH